MSSPFRKKSCGAQHSRKLPWVAATLSLLLATGTPAYAFWAATSSSSRATAAADALSPGSAPTVNASGASLSVNWTAGTTINGRAASGYKVTRFSTASGGTGTPATGGCAGTLTTTSCTEQNVPGGIWYYTVTPTIALWNGAESPRSTGVSNDSNPPTTSASWLSPASNSSGWNNASPVTFTITADDGPGGSGVASISYRIDANAQQTVSAASATVSVSGDGAHTISYFATDKAGNLSATQTKEVKIDTRVPSASASVSPAPNGSSLNNTSPVDVTLTADDETAGSGVASISYSVDNGVTQTVSGASVTIPVGGEGTHNVSYTATDKAGNSSSPKTQTVKIDLTAPATRPVTLATGATGSAKAGTIDVGDTVNVAFSEGMDLSRFCPSWTGSPIDGTATITNGTTDPAKDTVSFTSTACPGLNIGTINLGANHTDVFEAVFAATTNNNGKKTAASTLHWNPANNSLVITLGALSSGSVVSQSPYSNPVYTPNSGLADLAGNALPTAPSPLPTPLSSTRF